MKNYFRVMLGGKSIHAQECFDGGFIGVDYGIAQDLSNDLPENWRDFNRKFIPVFLTARPGKTKIAAGLACGAVWTVGKGIKTGDMVLCPNGAGSYRLGEVSGEYFYVPGQVLPHRRPVRWLSQTINRADMSEALQSSTGAPGPISKISDYAEEIERLVGGGASQVITASDPTIEDPAAFALESHLEEFLVQNWAQTELGKDFDIYEEEGQRVGQQFATDTGEIDILAISKDKKRLLVVELKKGRASDAVVGQIQRYMGFVIEELAEEGQTVEGLIIAFKDDQRIRRALAVAPNIRFYKYQITFKLLKA